MINRILIRIKVVQMLYAYLLTRTDFKIEKAPEEAELPSIDRKFAYRVYQDLLLLMLEVAGLDTHASQSPAAVRPDKKLAQARVPRALAADQQVRAIIFKNSSDIDALRHLAQALHDAVAESAVYTDFKRRRTATLSDEVKMWSAIITTVFAKNEALNEALRQLDGFSSVGLEQGITMLRNTLLSYDSTTSGYTQACNALEASLDKAYELYMSIFALIIELTQEQERRLETAKAKHLATDEDRNPNLKFVNNAFARMLMESEELQGFCEKHTTSWNTDVALINALLDSITNSEAYAQYMDDPVSNFPADCEFWRTMLKTVVFPADSLAEELENKSVYWNDALPIMGTFVLKTIKQASFSNEFKPLPQYKDDEDALFGAELFTDTVKNREDYRELIDKFVNSCNWDPDRLAFMDLVIMMTAISELINYPQIPLAVTMNEYIEIANSYSTAKSGQFVNGTLFNIVGYLREQGRLDK